MFLPPVLVSSPSVISPEVAMTNTSILSHYFKVTQVQKKQQQRLIIFLRGLYVLRPDLFELLSEMNFNFTCLHTLV